MTEIVVDNAVFRLSGDIRDRSLKLSEIAPNFGLVCPPKFEGGWLPKKLYPNYHACIAARHVEKFREVTRVGLGVITANKLNFKPICNCSFFLNCWVTPVAGGVCASKPRSICSACKNLIWNKFRNDVLVH